MPGSATIGNLNVKVTASAQQFTAIMDDMARQAQMTGQRMGEASRGFGELAEAGEHVHHMNARMVMSLQHAGVALGEGGIAGGMHAAIHAATHLALHMEGIQGAIAPLIVGGIAVSLLAEHWKKAGEEMEKAAEKANGLHEAMEKIAEAQKKAAENIRLQNLGKHGTAEKIDEEIGKKREERDALIERRKKIEEEQAKQDEIINQPKRGTGIFGMEDYYTRDQKAEIANAKKNREALDKEHDKTNREIDEKIKERNQLEKDGAKARHEEEVLGEIEARGAAKEAGEKEDKDFAEANRKSDEARQKLIHDINSKSKAGQIQNIRDEAAARLKELDKYTFTDEERKQREAQIAAGMKADIAAVEKGGMKEHALAGAQEFGSSAAFETVANAGKSSQDKVEENTTVLVDVGKKSLAVANKIEEGIAQPNMNLLKF